MSTITNSFNKTATVFIDQHKSHAGNTLSRFFKNEVETVKKLNFYEPDRKKDEYSLYNLKINNTNEKQDNEIDKHIDILKDCNYLINNHHNYTYFIYNLYLFNF